MPPPASSPSGWVLIVVRIVAGISAIWVSGTTLVNSSGGPDPALRWTILLLGIFILFHLLVEVFVVALPVRSGQDENVPSPFNTVANVLVTTPGVVLGLLAAFGTTGTLTIVVKVAAFALAMALLLAIVLNGLVSMKDVSKPLRSTVIRFIFNLTVWALALGIIRLAMGIAYRT
jgi:hypothetical protein